MPENSPIFEEQTLTSDMRNFLEEWGLPLEGDEEFDTATASRVAGGLGDYASGTPQPMDLGQKVGGGARQGFAPYEETPTQHTVEEGDTLSQIAQGLGLDTNQLAELNQIQDPNKIQVGQILNLIGLGDKQPPQETPSIEPYQADASVEPYGFIGEPDRSPEITEKPSDIQTQAEPTTGIAPHQRGVEEKDILTWNSSKNKFESNKESVKIEVDKIAKSFNVDPDGLTKSLELLISELGGVLFVGEDPLNLGEYAEAQQKDKKQIAELTRQEKQATTQVEKEVARLNEITKEREELAVASSEAKVLAQRAEYKKAAKERQAVKEKRPVKQVVKQKTEKKTVPKKKEVKVDKTQQESEAKVLAKREEYKKSSKERELASEERMKKNLVEQAKKANVEKEVAQLDKTTEKAMSKELWLGKSRVAKQGYFSLFAGGPKVSKKVYDEHLKGVINSYIDQVKKREEESSTGLEDIKQYPDKRLLERLRDLEFRSFDKKLGSIEKKEMATIKQEIKNRNRTPPTYRRGYKLKPLPLG